MAWLGFCLFLSYYLFCQKAAHVSCVVELLVEGNEEESHGYFVMVSNMATFLGLSVEFAIVCVQKSGVFSRECASTMVISYWGFTILQYSLGCRIYFKEN